VTLPKTGLSPVGISGPVGDNTDMVLEAAQIGLLHKFSDRPCRLMFIRLPSKPLNLHYREPTYYINGGRKINMEKSTPTPELTQAELLQRKDSQRMTFVTQIQ
jgi:hypothetical protein